LPSKGIYYLVLDGETPFERGYQHGTALEFPIRKALRQFRAWTRAVLGLLVLVRTFLSWALVVEIEGRWPWQGPGDAQEGREEK
jgi:hypothetical protein